MNQKQPEKQMLESVVTEFKSIIEKFEAEDLLEIFNEVLAAFLQEEKTRNDAYRAAIVQRNPSQLASAAHALKGSFATLGQKTLHSRMETLERNAREQRIDWGAEKKNFESFCAELELLVKVAEKYLQRDLRVSSST
ncbi:Hpt domain-containing protein [bacterium]|nr:Hpt domain-containing protein [bacterium]